MNWREISIVWRKEMLDTLRDRRTIMAMIVVPLLVYPVLIIVISQIGIAQVEKLKASAARVALLPADGSPALVDALAHDTTIVIVESENPETDLRDRKIDAVIRLPYDFEDRMAHYDSVVIAVRVDLSRDRGDEMRDRLQDFLSDWRNRLVTERLETRELPEAFNKPFWIQVDNAAGGRKMGGSLIGRFLPFLLVVMMISGAFYPAIDVTAGERERGTLETLLVVPANRFNIVIGKFLTVFVASMVTTLANIASIAFTAFFLIGSANLGGQFAANLTSVLDWRAFLLIFVIMIPLGILFSSISMLTASFARSFKEAQNYLSPLMIACMAPAYLSFLPGVEIDRTWSLVPIANVVLLSRELLLGNYAWPYFAITMATMTALALLFMHRTVNLFGGEAMLGGAGTGAKFSLKSLFERNRGGYDEELTPGVVGPTFLLVLLGFFYVGTPLQMWNIPAGLALTQILVIAGIPILAMRLLHMSPFRELGVTPPPQPAVYLFALLAAPTATLIAALVATLQGTFMEVPDSYREIMQRLIAGEGERSLWLSLLVFAVIPGFCEEILFRGFVLRGLARRMNPVAAILWTALLFGVFHFDMYRLLPTAALGVVMGLAVWMTGSLWPAIVIHVTNNAVAVLANNVEALKQVPWLQEGGNFPPGMIVAVLVLGSVGVWGLLRAKPSGRPLGGSGDDEGGTALVAPQTEADL